MKELCLRADAAITESSASVSQKVNLTTPPTMVAEHERVKISQNPFHQLAAFGLFFDLATWRVTTI